MDREATSPTGASQVRLDFTATDTDNARAAFPDALDPRLPSADRMGTRIHAVLGDTAQAAVRLCVAPSGKVASVELERGSSMIDFDAALLNDIQAWQFAEMPGPANVKTCERFTISYRPI
jgi:hypothetical protein